MTYMIQTIKTWEITFDQKAEHFIFKHPFLSFVGIVVGVPIFILAAVGVSTTIVILPIAWKLYVVPWLLTLFLFIFIYNL